MEKFVVIDLETTGHASGKDDKIIEIGLVTIENGEITEQFTTFLNPNKKIPPFISGLTGIRDVDVQDAPTFSSIAGEIRNKFTDACLVAHNVPFDMGFLNDELIAAGYEKLDCPAADTVELSRILYPQAPSYKLANISEYLGIDHDAPHRALSDAYVTAKLFLCLKEKLLSLPYETLNHIMKIEKKLKSDFALLLKAKIESSSPEEDHPDIITHRGLAFRKIEIEKKDPNIQLPSFNSYLDELYGQGMQRAFRSYEKRPGQRQMSELVFDAFESRKHALIEAETGTGKTLAYLLPAVYEAVKKEERIVISTHTTQLQTQLLEEEIPLVQDMIDFPIHTALLKGKYHYLSLEKFAYELAQPEIGNYDVALSKAMLLVWITETVTGDIDEIQLPSNGYHFYRKVSAEAEGEMDPFSSWFRYSYHQYAKRKAQRADLIITNHALLSSDMYHDYQLLPAYTRAIIDEAHHFEQAVSNKYGLKLDYVRMQFTMNELGQSDEKHLIGKLLGIFPNLAKLISVREWDQLFEKTQLELDELFRHIFSFVLEHNHKQFSDTGRIQYRFEHGKEAGRAWAAIKEMTSSVIFCIRDLIHLLFAVRDAMELSEPGADENDAVRMSIEQLQDHIDQLEQFFLIEEKDQVKWIEIESKGARNAVYLFSEPVSVVEQLKECFFSVKESVILTSATLTMNESFRFMREKLGLDENQTFEKKFNSPFNYKDQLQLLIPDDFPDIRYHDSDDFIYSVCEAVLSLAEITEGRMLVLFTSFDMLKQSYGLLKEFMMDDEYALIAQGITSGSRARLKKNFQSYDKAILLGTSSFWEGVDIPGEDLSCLVIARLPFQPPNHPVYEAKVRILEEQGKNPFYDFALPNAVIRFKQGFGRLIRTQNDRGIVFVCDARIKKAGYGKYFIRSIPEVPIYFDSTSNLLQTAKEWF